MESTLENPYVGPRSFEEQHKNLFFGRDAEAGQLFSMVLSERLVLFSAQSGAGKSSLLNTRLRPALAKENFQVFPTARVGVNVPSGIETVDNAFVFNLITSIDKKNPERFAHITLSEYLPTIHDDGAADPDADYERARILIIDQFEEIVTTNLNRWQDRKPFFQQLAEAMKVDPLLWVLLVMREDHVLAVEPDARLLPGGLRTRFYMQRMKRAAALEAICEPAKQGGREFTPAAAEKLVDNLRQLPGHQQEDGQPALGEYVEPVQLQVVCLQLWKNLNAQENPPDKISEQDLETFGDVDTALAQFYESTLAAVLQETKGSELALRDWFERQLITEAGTRGTVFRGEKTTEGLANDTVRLLADKYYLLRTESRAGGIWYELVHDRLVGPIKQANLEWRLRQSPLLRAAEAWDRSDDRSLLYTDEQLKNTLEAVKWDSLEPVIQEFLTASQEAQRQRDLEKHHSEMEERTRRAEAEARTAKRLRFLTAALILAVAVAIWFAYSARVERDAAEVERDRAVAAQEESQISAVLALAAQAQAEGAQDRAELSASAAAEARQEAEAQADLLEGSNEELEASRADAARLAQIALAQSLSLQANESFEEGNSELATLLAIEALQISQSGNTILLDRILHDQSFNISLAGHQYTITSLAFNVQNQLLASADENGTILLWQLATPAALPTPLHHQGATVLILEFSPDGDQLVALDSTGRVQVWDVAALAPEFSEPTVLEEYDEPILGFEFDGSGLRLATAGDDQTIHIWNVHTAISQTIVLDQQSPVRSLAFSPDGETIAAVFDNMVQLWNIDQPNEPLATESPGDTIFETAVFSADGLLLAAGGSDTSGNNGKVYLWFVSEMGNPALASLPPLSEYDDSIVALSFDPSGQSLVAADNSGRVWLWDTIALALVELYHQEGSTQTLSFSPDGQYLATGHGNGHIRLWPLTAAGSSTALGSSFPVWSVAFSPDGNTLASAGGDALHLWQAEDFLATNDALPDILFSIPAERSSFVAPNAITFGRDASGNVLLAAVDFANGVYLWRAEQLPPLSPTILDPIQLNEHVNEGEGHTGQNETIAFNDDASLMAVGSEDKTITLWDISEPDNPVLLSKLIDQHQDKVSSVLFSRDGQLLASADQSGGLLLWNVEQLLAEGQPLVQLIGHEAWINGLSFSPDGQWLASGSDDDSLKLWDIHDLAAGTTLTPTSLLAHQGNVYAVAFSPDEKWLASADESGVILLWDTNDYSQPARQFSNDDDAVWSVAFSPDSDLLAAGTESGGIRLWPILANNEEIINATCRRLSRNLTMDEWQNNLQDVAGDYQRTCVDILPDITYVQSLLVNSNVQDVLAELEEITGSDGEQVLVWAITTMLENQPSASDLDQARQWLLDVAELYPDNDQLAYLFVALALRYLDVDPNSPVGLEMFQEATVDGDVLAKLPQDSLFILLDLCTSSLSATDTDAAALFCVDETILEIIESLQPTVLFRLCYLQTMPTFANIGAKACALIDERGFVIGSIQPNQPVHGEVVSGASELWLFTFDGTPGQTISVRLNKEFDDLDPYLEIWGADGQVLAADDDSGGNFNSRIDSFSLPGAGIYYLRAIGYNATTGAYELILELSAGG